MGYIVVAPVGDNTKALFVGMKEFPTEKVILVSPTENMKEAQKLADKLKDFTIDSEIIEMREHIMEDMFKIFGNLCTIYDPDRILVNVATGDRMSTCAALSAAFANGLKSMGTMGDNVMLLPIMKLSYYNELSETKMRILKQLNTDEPLALKDLAQKLKMSASLLSYHINGNYKHKGLNELRLVEVQERNKNILVKVSQMGKLLLKGYIQRPQ